MSQFHPDLPFPHLDEVIPEAQQRRVIRRGETGTTVRRVVSRAGSWLMVQLDKGGAPVVATLNELAFAEEGIVIPPAPQRGLRLVQGGLA